MGKARSDVERERPDGYPPGRFAAGDVRERRIGFQTPSHNKIVSAPVMSARSIRARSRVNSIAKTKNNASKGIRFTRVIVVSNSSLQPKLVPSPCVLLLPPATEVSVNENQTYKFVQPRLVKRSDDRR
jgi:hypothetical protein